MFFCKTLRIQSTSLYSNHVKKRVAVTCDRWREITLMVKYCIREEGLEILLANIDDLETGINSGDLGTLWLDAGVT